MKRPEQIFNLRLAIVARIARLIECTRMLDLNRSDGDLKDRSGEVFYVLDTNVLQAFLQPAKQFELMRLFHHGLWSPDPREEAADYDLLNKAIGAQAALLATEFILSSQMRAAGDRVFMSLPHLNELEGQIRRFRSDLRKVEREDPSYDIMQTPKRIREVLELPGLELEEALLRIKRDPLFISPALDSIDKLSTARRERLRDD